MIKRLIIPLILIFCLLPAISCSLVETTTSSLLPSIADVVAEVKPSVVAINTEVVTYDIFNQPYTQTRAGSGWIINEDGLIVTNNHVVEGAESIAVTLDSGETFTAETVCGDSLSDLAVIKINASGLPPVNIGDSSQLRVGDWAVAIGNPLGLGISAKEGIISRLNISLEISSGQTLQDLIETSAAVNPGNSGGPLVNMAGEVVGITSAKIAMVGVEGMGYAISINSANSIIEQLITGGYVVRPWLGVVSQTVSQWLAFIYDLAVNEGAFITEVASDSPADEAGLAPGDIIVGINDTEIATVKDLTQAIHSYQIGQTVEITFWRGDNQNITCATLVESPPP
jgi:serine protease Do